MVIGVLYDQQSGRWNLETLGVRPLSRFFLVLEPTLISKVFHVRLYVAAKLVVVQIQSDMDFSLCPCSETGFSMQHKNTPMDMVGYASEIGAYVVMKRSYERNTQVLARYMRQ